jgi:hypothetical protein
MSLLLCGTSNRSSWRPQAQEKMQMNFDLADVLSSDILRRWTTTCINYPNTNLAISKAYIFRTAMARSFNSRDRGSTGRPLLRSSQTPKRHQANIFTALREGNGSQSLAGQPYWHHLSQHRRKSNYIASFSLPEAQNQG